MAKSLFKMYAIRRIEMICSAICGEHVSIFCSSTCQDFCFAVQHDMMMMNKVTEGHPAE